MQDAFYQQSINHPDVFWAEQAQRIDWHKPFEQVCDYSRPPFARWFVGGETNLCHNAVDRWAKIQPDQPALIAISTETADGTPVEKVWTYQQLLREVERTAAIMQALGVAKGDRVLIYNQLTGYWNGVYTVTTVGTPDPGGTNWVLTRATDADTYSPYSPTSLGQGDAFFVTNGLTGAGETYICNTVGTITFGIISEMVGGMRPSILSLVTYFIIGLILLFTMRSKNLEEAST